VVGPYTGVNARLTLLSSTTRVRPHLVDPPHACCANGTPGNGYAVLRDDARVVNQYAATEAIVTSSGQNDAGLFELSFGDQRYLPFEFAGAVSRWRLELPRENNQFDVDTVADVVLHMNYTAREGGEVLRRAANEIAQRTLPGAGVRYFDVRTDLPDAWALFQASGSDHRQRELPLRLGANMFGFLPAEPDLRVSRIELFFEAPGAGPSAHHLVEFLAAAPASETKTPGGGRAEPDRYETQEIRCVARAAWPGLYHGVLDGVDLGPVRRDAVADLGTFRFPAELGEVSRTFLCCEYTTAENGRTASISSSPWAVSTDSGASRACRGSIKDGKQACARFGAKLAPQHRTVGLVAAQSLDPVALREMSFEQHALGAFAQRFGADRHHRRLDRFGEPFRNDQLVAECFERVQHPLADALAFEQHPVVVPTGQQVERGGAGHGHGQVARLGMSTKQPGRPLVDQVDVDEDVVAQDQRVLVRDDQVDAGAVQPPQRRAQVARGALVVPDGPQRAGRVAPVDPAAVEGDEDQQPLASLGYLESVVAGRDERPTEQT